jgi:hypothetical protein
METCGNIEKTGICGKKISYFHPEIRFCMFLSAWWVRFQIFRFCMPGVGDSEGLHERIFDGLIHPQQAR